MAARLGKRAKRTRGADGESVRKELNSKLGEVLQSRANANSVFDILEYLESENDGDVQAAIRTCSKLFESLLEKGELYVGDLPSEDEHLPDSMGAEQKYKIWMRHRYKSCVSCLVDLLHHNSFQLQELALCMLMKFIVLEGKFPLEAAKWKDGYRFPHPLLKLVVAGLLPEDKDLSTLITRFQEYLEYDDVRYYTMSWINENIAQVHKNTKEVRPAFQNNVFGLLSSINMPVDNELSNFLVVQKEKCEDWKPAKLKEHKRMFEKVWMNFLKNKLAVSLYKKVLLILHESILPHMSKPTLMIDFLTAAYDIGGAISLLALNGLFLLIHQHNLEYPDFYKKLYSLLDPSVFHVKYRARFFHLANLFLSSTHLPVYLVAAFAKRLSRLSLTAPPQVLLMIIPFICNLIRRHPACRPLIHRPMASGDLISDPFIMEEQDPAKSQALESSLWELEALQNHYYPDVVRGANVISRALSSQESEISELLEFSSYELFEKQMKKRFGSVPLEFEPVRGILGRKQDITAEHFSL
ncbi:PREDICTED: nucleolar complex protein 4 homolog isoform X2 [Nanorana parkeri]|uniref:nucleolar complex protein 4 homolog isoform X2 n=1 Tax=Nanorana parkeri TaxID=125878 RepID=UPI0008541FC2|nr:PREDICTED: nucleolar complex protein 4 homolog isoform X2 [Nanorana parkeri]